MHIEDDTYVFYAPYDVLLNRQFVVVDWPSKDQSAKFHFEFDKLSGVWTVVFEDLNVYINQATGLHVVPDEPVYAHGDGVELVFDGLLCIKQYRRQLTCIFGKLELRQVGVEDVQVANIIDIVEGVVQGEKVVGGEVFLDTSGETHGFDSFWPNRCEFDYEGGAVTFDFDRHIEGRENVGCARFCAGGINTVYLSHSNLEHGHWCKRPGSIIYLNSHPGAYPRNAKWCKRRKSKEK